MKKYLIIFVGMIYCQAFAQNEYPLAIGNTWYYTITYEFYQPPLPPSYSAISVIGDSIMSNGKRYWILDHHDMLGGRYVRCDSGNIYYWQSGIEKLVVNLNASLGTIDTIAWIGFLTSRCTGEYQSTLFGNSTNIHSYSLGGLLFGDLTFATGFGYNRYEYHADQPSQIDVWELTGCIISDTLHGTTDVNHVSQELPQQFALFQNYPNPFNPSTIISFSVSSRSFVSLKVYDLLGREVATIVSKELPAGNYFQHWNASTVSSGAYFYQLQTNNYCETIKLILLK